MFFRRTCVWVVFWEGGGRAFFVFCGRRFVFVRLLVFFGLGYGFRVYSGLNLGFVIGWLVSLGRFFMFLEFVFLFEK